MTVITSLDHVHEVGERVARQLERGQDAWVVGSVGSGSRTLAALLGDLLSARNPVVVDLLPLLERNADAVAHGLAQLVAHCGQDVRRGALEAWGAGADATSLADTLPRDQPLVVLVPDDWLGSKHDSDWDEVRRRHAVRLLAALRATGSPRVYITGRSADPRELDLGDPPPSPIPLHRPDANLGYLDVEEAWGTYAAHAAALHDVLEDGAKISPVALRLGVGAVGLGVSAQDVGASLGKPKHAVQIKHAAQCVSHGLRNHQQLRDAVGRFFRTRRPVPRSWAVEVTRVEEYHAPFITECVGYGGDAVRVSPAVLKGLARTIGDAGGDVHRELAHRYRELDGVPAVHEAVVPMSRTAVM